MENPVRLLAIAFVLLVIGAVLPFLMVIKLIESTFPLNFLAVVCSIAGIITGFLGMARYLRPRK